MKRIISIVGMGLSGNAVFCRLIQLLQGTIVDCNEIKILIFEENSAHFATGFAYSIQSPDYWTLNNPADGFKFISGTLSLTEWIKTELPDLVNNPYLPRAIVGQYLRAQYAKFKQIATDLGIAIEVIHQPVEVMYELPDGRYQIKANNIEYYSDAAFLTTGHLQSSHFQHIEHSSGFIRLDKITDDTSIPEAINDVYVIGGQAGFVDVALWLSMRIGFSGKIHSVTRHPSILTTKGNPDTCNTEAQQKLTEKLNQCQSGSVSYSECRKWFWSAYQQDAKSPLDPEHLPGTQEALTTQMRKMDRGNAEPIPSGNIDELRAFIKTFYLNGCYAIMWQSLNDDGKKNFLNCFYSLLMAFLTGTSPVNARLLLALYQNQRIMEHQGLVDISYHKGKQCFILSLKTGAQLEASLLIDASGYRYKPDAQANKPMLLDNLAQTGLIKPNPLGGIQLTEDFQVVDINGRIHPNLFCLGPVANFNHPVPTPHSSFMVGPSVERAVMRLSSSLKDDQARPSFAQ